MRKLSAPLHKYRGESPTLIHHRKWSRMKTASNVVPDSSHRAVAKCTYRHPTQTADPPRPGHARLFGNWCLRMGYYLWYRKCCTDQSYLMIACAKLGLDFVACTTEDYFPNEELVEECRVYAKESGSEITLTYTAGWSGCFWPTATR